MKKVNGIALLFVVWIVVAGCATHRNIDWQGRIGRYSYDQAITEMGPPDKSAQLSDGSTIAEWYQEKEHPFSFGLGFGVGTGPIGVAMGVPLGGDSIKTLQLTFGPDGLLRKAPYQKMGTLSPSQPVHRPCHLDKMRADYRFNR